MAEKDQDAAIENGRRESKAEAFSFTFASVMVSGFPTLLILLTIILAVLGQDVAAIITGIVGLTSAGPQIISAIRSSRRRED